MNTKIAKIKELLNGELDDITIHKVTKEWYQRYIDMDYDGGDVEIVQFSYDYELYAAPAYMPLEEFNRLTAQEIADRVEI